MNILSLFDGISCGMVALEKANIQVDNYFAYEIDKAAIKCSQSNYPQIKHFGDVMTADFSKHKNVGLLIGGSPCTYWSVIKSGRETTSDGQGFILFRQFTRALAETGCKYFLYENNASIRKDIKSEISKALGVEEIMINSRLLSAQDRKLCYWTNIPFEKTIVDKGILLQSILEFGNTERAKSKTVRVGGVGSGWGNKHEWDMPNPERQYTRVELERLQTLPDGYTKVLTERQAQKAIGNGWTIDVIAYILSGFSEVIKNGL